MVGRTYAEIFFAFLRDQARQQKAGRQPLYLLELGGGSGRLAYHFLKNLSQLCESAAFVVPRFCYILSDLAPKNVAFWKTHPRFKPFVEKKILDFARFDANKDTNVKLIVSKKELKPRQLRKPLVILANYFFDSIPQDLVHVQDGRVYETRLNLTAASGPGRTTAPAEWLENVQYGYTDHPLKNTYYPEKAFNRIIENYREWPDTYLFFPLVGLRALERLRGLSQKGFMLFSADKGQYQFEALAQHQAPDLIKHGSFSLWVNYHALQQFYENQGAMVLLPGRAHHSLTIACILALRRPGDYPETIQAYGRRVERFGPDDFFSLKKHFENHIDSMDLRHLLAYLRLSGYDARFFQQGIEHFEELIVSLDPSEKQELSKIIDKVWEMYFPLGEEYDLAFGMARVLLKIGYYQKALEYYRRSLERYPEEAYTYGDMAVCARHSQDLEAALTYIEKAIKLNGKGSRLVRMRREILGEMESDRQHSNQKR